MQTISPSITDVTDGLFFPEGPVWCDDGSVLVVELGGACVTRVAPDGTKTKVSDNGGSPNGQAIGPDGALYVCNSGGWDWIELGPMRITAPDLPAHHSGGRIERVDLATGDVRVLYRECDGNPLIGPNDIVFDREGGMWFTDHGRHAGRIHHLGGVYYAQPDGSSIREVLFPLDAPNGIGLAPDGSRLYVAETHTGRVRVLGRDRAGPARHVGDRARPRRRVAARLRRDAAARFARDGRRRQRRGRHARDRRRVGDRARWHPPRAVDDG